MFYGTTKRGGHSISINACEVWEARVGVQVSRREFHTHIHLDYDRVKILFYIKKKRKYVLWRLKLVCQEQGS